MKGNGLQKVGAIDAGGTSWRCAIIDEDLTILARSSFPTTSPQETLGLAAGFFRAQKSAGLDVSVIGVGCFGPLAVNPKDSRWGHILATTKPGWAGADVAGVLAEQTGARITLDTDVTAAALAERAWGAGQGYDDLAYVTVGTGIGAGIIVDGKPIWGSLHPEAGHMRVPRHRDDQEFAGICSFHRDCIEGLASAPAMAARWGQDASELGDDDIAWDIEAYYLGQLSVNLVLTNAIQRIILGGGVMVRHGLVERVAVWAASLLGPYSVGGEGEVGFDVVGAGLGLDAGLFGGAWLGLNR
ncbi:ROK family protein [Candidatus Phycosocius spiralis]|uniref:fructokinase n=1 Tax=Candidatus Phycosocius spiralis TaxID=2815099 RepID=A0ABQ4PXM0_9PROT|nr:ROK family protein [Candidatus Phycosocius spiralis]GIU67811.1 fructokinase [Candidatus Phycosocius spiralis]